jgi:lipopolysaccharide/colanic/teichoic acid biosynthesis glycosyltransferase
MTTNDAGEYGTAQAKINKITRVGKFLRQSRIDELPQLISVLKGDQSLIGPRPELPALVAQYDKEIPYYNVRHMIKPGLSGWAQVYGEHGHGQVAVAMTKNKLSYDLFYVKNRSVLLDAIISLKTIAILVSFVGK